MDGPEENSPVYLQCEWTGNCSEACLTLYFLGKFLPDWLIPTPTLTDKGTIRVQNCQLKWKHIIFSSFDHTADRYINRSHFHTASPIGCFRITPNRPEPASKK